MTRWTAADLPDMAGRTVIVTGGSRGLGQVTARELARVAARVVLAVRNPGKAAPVAAAMSGRVEVRQLDVADLGSVRRFASGWSGNVDVLVNNAGTMNGPLSRTADGFESQVATNYLGPFTLTNPLLPQITDRVVTVSSQLHRQGRPRRKACDPECAQGQRLVLVPTTGLPRRHHMPAAPTGTKY